MQAITGVYSVVKEVMALGNVESSSHAGSWSGAGEEMGNERATHGVSMISLGSMGSYRMVNAVCESR